DCIKERTYAGSNKCLLGHILIYYEGHQPQYTHLEVLYKIENVSAFFKQAKQKTSYLDALQDSQSKNSANTSKFQCLYKISFCAICEAEGYYSKEAVKKFIKESNQWCDKEEKIHDPDSNLVELLPKNPNVVYWPKNRHWESIKNITKSTAPSICDP
ncbi:614_t:CDS:2, partial [Cetraspora pellucida]